MKLPDEYAFPKVYSFEREDDPEALQFIKIRNYLRERLLNGTLYVKFVKGNRAGSIAKVECDGPGMNEKSSLIYHGTWGPRWIIDNPYFSLRAKWDKRKNSCHLLLPNEEVVILPNYQGQTVYEMFDKKSAKEAALKNPNQYDIDGKLLEIGDEVLYINARYGSGFELCHGAIQEFKAASDSYGNTISTIVKHADSDQVSSISNPTTMIWKR
jgi:hypothetical protein